MAAFKPVAVLAVLVVGFSGFDLNRILPLVLFSKNLDDGSEA